MYVLTFKGRPQTFKAVMKREYGRSIAGSKASGHSSFVDDPTMYIAASTKSAVKAAFIYHAGFDWQQHAADGYGIKSLNNVSLRKALKRSTEDLENLREYATAIRRLVMRKISTAARYGFTYIDLDTLDGVAVRIHMNRKLLKGKK